MQRGVVCQRRGNHGGDVLEREPEAWRREDECIEGVFSRCVWHRLLQCIRLCCVPDLQRLRNGFTRRRDKPLRLVHHDVSPGLVILTDGFETEVLGEDVEELPLRARHGLEAHADLLALGEGADFALLRLCPCRGGGGAVEFEREV